jgi:phage major head subunit gpT-like protein
MSLPLLQQSGDAQRALEEFSTEFDAAFEAADPQSEWSTMLGMVRSSTSLLTTFPMVVSAAGYVERKGDDKLRSLYERSFSITPKEWADGVAERARILEQPNFGGWAGEPARIAREARRHPNILVAVDILEGNPNLDFYIDKSTGGGTAKALFATDHPCNIFDSAFGTFSNSLVQADTSTATSLNSAVMRAVFKNMATRKGANGRLMRLRPTTLLCSPNREEECKDFLQSDLDRAVFLEGGVAAQKNTQLTTNNRWKNIVDLQVIDEATSAMDHLLFFVDKNSAAKPWVIQDGGTPKEITYGYEDALYKDQGMLAKKFVMLMGAAACLPHAITRVNLNA